MASSAALVDPSGIPRGPVQSRCWWSVVSKCSVAPVAEPFASVLADQVVALDGVD